MLSMRSLRIVLTTAASLTVCSTVNSQGPAFSLAELEPFQGGTRPQAYALNKFAVVHRSRHQRLRSNRRLGAERTRTDFS